jgi:DNA-binding NarL/FixJ family response regulator
MAEAEALVRGRLAFGRGQWRAAHADLSAADRTRPLTAEDLQRLATAAYLIGRDIESEEIWARAHLGWLDSAAVDRAVRCAFWLTYSLLGRGELGPASGWIARGHRLLADRHSDCVEQGYLLFPQGLQTIDQGDAATAYATFDQVVKLGERFRDPDLVAMGRLGLGVALLRLGETEAGMASFDEAMVSISVAEVSPIAVGVVYCGVIQECHAAFDVRRAQEWTAALSRWCDAQPDLVPFRGQCLVHRAQILQLRGYWPEAAEEIRRACERLSTPPGQPALGLAHYQRAELHRLRGAFTQAETAYREADRYGHSPLPGLALLHLAQGDVDGSAAAIRVCLEQTSQPGARPELLAACVEIQLARGEIGLARAAADELSAIASEISMPLLDAVSARCTGAVLLAEGEPGPALIALGRSVDAWRELEASYELARARVLKGQAHRALDDPSMARLEFAAAGRAFREVGAAPALALLGAEVPHGDGAAAHDRLTFREEQVLRLVAAGKSNGAIATELLISEHTIARHVQNIFAKLGLSSRTAATAYAYEIGLITPGRGQN